MGQRNSGYDRKEREFYATPAWVTQALIDHAVRLGNRGSIVWEPAAGSGAMTEVLRDNGFAVLASDITDGRDFLTWKPKTGFSGIVTNPPYGQHGALAMKFIMRALELTRPFYGFVAMLLRIDFDSALTRRCVFADFKPWAEKLVLTKRIVWFEQPGKRSDPSENHAWYIWNWHNVGKPIISYSKHP